MTATDSDEGVTIGVPVYRGERFVEETLASVQRQTHRAIEVIVSLDGPDDAAERLCRPFLSDPRFRLVVQPARLGWVRHLNWLMARVRTPFWCYQQQDDLLDPCYLEVLLDYARTAPEAAVVYCDIAAFGSFETTFVQPSVTGSAVSRQLALLCEHQAAVAFRGLTRAEALAQAPHIPGNTIGSFACDTAWMAAMARWGELRRVPVTLYRKRYHDANEHTRWSRWSLKKRIRAWVVHCAVMLEQAMLVEATTYERRLLWLAAVGRLISPRTAGRYLPIAEFGAAARTAVLDAFFEHVQTDHGRALPELLGAQWDEIRLWSREFYREPATSPHDGVP
jgi:glycosyltransferase involved in cell wall biosynthesis